MMEIGLLFLHDDDDDDDDHDMTYLENQSLYNYCDQEHATFRHKSEICYLVVNPSYRDP